MNRKFLRMSLLVRIILEKNSKLKIGEIQKEMVNRFEAYEDFKDLKMHEYPISTFDKDKKAIRKLWKIDLECSQDIYTINTDFEGVFQNDLLNSAIFLSSLNSDMMLPEYVIPETRKNTGLEHFQTISEAIQNENKIEISYFDYTSEKEKVKEIYPYKIKQKDFKWYVLATDDSNVPFKSYALERIKKIEVLDKLKPKEEKEKKINFDEPYKDAIGMFTDGKPEEIIVEYDHRDGHYLKANPIHHSQKVISETADRIQFQFFVKPNNDFLMELLKRSWSLKVVQPESLKERIMGFWRDAMERNL